jgi:phosphoribosylanthranilate isomerase
MIRVKICGITRPEDAALAVELGAWAIGFVFWPASPRFVSPSAAAEIAAAVPERVERVGVFVNQPTEHILATVAGVKLSIVQLHGTETAEECLEVAHPVIKAVGLTGSADEERVLAMPPAVTVLLDAHDPARFGGTGRTVDWASAARIARARPVVLSGGLRVENVADAIAMTRPYAVDVSSGVEARPGIKAPDRLRAFMAAVRAAGQGFA